MKKRSTAPVHPAVLMSLYWSALYIVYLVVPIHQLPKISGLGFAFVVANVVTFFIGATFCARLALTSSGYSAQDPATYTSYRAGPTREHLLIRLALLIGIVGGLLSAYGKLSLVGEYSLAAITGLRADRAQELLHAGGLRSGIASIIAFFLYPAGFVGLVAIILRYESVSLGTRILAGSYLFVIFLLAIIAGGRSPILVLFLFLAIASYLRMKLYGRWLPSSAPLKIGLLVLFAAFIAYSSLIWTVRINVSGLTIDAFLTHAEAVWGVRPSEFLIFLSDWLHRPDLLQSVMSSFFYFTQNLSVTERILESRHDIVPLLGGYQIDLVAAVLRTFPEGAEFLARGNQVLLDANIYGFFAGAWGSLFIDMGYWCFIGTLIWGYLAGRAYRRLKRGAGLAAETTYVFWIYSILISFVSTPFGFSNSLMTFLWFVAFRIMLSVSLRNATPAAA